MGLAPSSPAGLARGSSTKSLLSPTFNGSSANLLSGTTNRGSGSNEPQSARRVPPHIGQQGRHPTSRRAGSKLDLIKVSITEDPAVLRVSDNVARATASASIYTHTSVLDMLSHALPILC